MYNSFPKFCGVCGSRQRSLILDTLTGTITGFCCLGKHEQAPPLVISGPVVLDLSNLDRAWLQEIGVKGMSLIEVLVVVAVIGVVAAIGIPILLGAVNAVKGFAALLSQVVVH